MSAVQIIQASDKTYSNIGRHFCAELKNDKHSAVIVVKPAGVHVIVRNASNRCWQGMGRDFPNAEAALAYYKTPEIREMITATVEATKPAAKAV